MPYIQYDDHRRYFYACAGMRTPYPPAVLIHGAGGSHLDWPSALRRLPHRLTYAIDLPGHGHSAPPGRDSIEAYREWLCTLLDELALPPAVFIGHSMGSAIALDLALHAPTRVAGVVLIGAGARLEVAPAILERLLTHPIETIELFMELAYGPSASEEMKRIGRERLSRVQPAVLYGDFMACQKFDRTSRLHEVHVPALIIGGSEDRITPAKQAMYLHEHMPHSQLALMEGAGHMVPIERTDEVVNAIVRFLTDYTL